MDLILNFSGFIVLQVALACSSLEGVYSDLSFGLISMGTLSTPSIHVHSYGEHQKPFFSSLLLYTLATERTYVLSGWLLYVLDVLTDFIYTIGRYYVKWVKTSWTYSIMVGVNGNNHGF